MANLTLDDVIGIVVSKHSWRYLPNATGVGGHQHNLHRRALLTASHTTTLRVRFYELDPYDHVNHVNYLRYFETARVEFLSELGFGLDVLKESDTAVVVVELTARFRGQAKLHDMIEITTEVGEARGAISTWHQLMKLGDRVIAELDIRAAFTTLAGRARRIPPEFLERAGVLPASR